MLDDIIHLVETSQDMRQVMTDMLPARNINSVSPPLPRITYRGAVARLQASGLPIQFGANISRENEKQLTVVVHAE